MSLRELLDKQEITEVLHRRARASDRKDAALALSCYHEGATENHEGFDGPAEQFIRERSLISRDSPVKLLWHQLSNILIELRGDAAAVESYHVAVLLTDDGTSRNDVTIGGRYLDRFERRRTRWAIAHRDVVFDWSRIEPATDQYWDVETLDPARLLRGRFGPDDPLYDRLRIDRA